MSGSDIDIHAMLLRAEAKALSKLEELRPATASVNYEANLAVKEEQYATACAVRRNWEECERRASKENRSASSYKYLAGDTRVLVRSVIERNAIPADNRFLGLGVVLPDGKQYTLEGGLTNEHWKECC